MPKTPGQVGSEARINLCDSIIPRTSDLAQDLKSRSPHSSPPLQQEKRSPQKSTIPALPQHLDKLLDLPWNAEASQEIDWWLWSVAQKVEPVGGKI